jgi:hypothetical protein
LSKTASLVNSFVIFFCGDARYKEEILDKIFPAVLVSYFQLSCCVPCVFWIFLFLVRTGFVLLTAFLDKVEVDLSMAVLLLVPRRHKLLEEFEGFVLKSVPR